MGLKNLLHYKPTKGELFRGCIYLIGVLGVVILAERQFTIKPVPKETLAAGMQWVGGKPAPQELIKLTPVSNPLYSEPQEYRVSSPAIIASEEVAPLINPSAGVDDTDLWTPQTSELGGDARKIPAQMVTWLKAQLREVKVTRTHSGDELAVLSAVARKVGSMPYQITPGWKTPEETVAAKEGDCTDRSLLLATLLLKLGFKDVAVVTGVPYDYTVGDAGHAWVKVRVDGETWHVESTNGSVGKRSAATFGKELDETLTIWADR